MPLSAIACVKARVVVLGHLMEIGTELFAMAATCAYADHLARRDEGGGDPRRLASVFCDQARRRVDMHFRALGKRRDRRRMRALSRAVLDGSYRWMEDGIIPAAAE